MTTFATQIEGLRTVSGSAERDALFPSPPVGQKVYNATTDMVEKWTGSIWLPIMPQLPAEGRTIDSLAEYIANNAKYNVKDYGAIGDGTENFGGHDDTVAIQAAITAAVAAGGGTVYFPAGRYRTSSVLTVSGSRISFLGDGPQSELIGWDGAIMNITSQSKITFFNLSVTSCRGVMNFVLCTDLSFVNVYFDGLYGGNPFGQITLPTYPTARLSPGDSGYTLQLTPKAIVTQGCTRVHITGCTFKDCNDGVYLDKSGATVTSEVVIDKSFFFHEHHNNVLLATPTGVYLFNTDNVTVANCFFKNIQPQTTGDGYGVYEGDGTASRVSIIGCHFTKSDLSAGAFHGILISQARACVVDGCVFSTESSFEAFVYGAVNQVISNCIFDNTYVRTAGSVGPASYVSLIVANNEFRGATGVPLTVSDGTPGYDQVVISGNHFYNATKGAIWLRFCTFATVIGNAIINCNQSADSNDQYRGGINFVGCIDGLVDGNVIMNTTTDGKMQYGVVISASDHHVQITPTNRIRNMVTGSILRPLTAPPISGLWARGTIIHAWDATSGATLGWVCVASGTPGTWVAMAKGGVSVPEYTTGTTSTPNATATTIYTITVEGLYMVEAWESDAFKCMACFIARDTLNTSMLNAATANANINLSISGANIQITQSSGSTQNTTWRVLRI